MPVNLKPVEVPPTLVVTGGRELRDASIEIGHSTDGVETFLLVGLAGLLMFAVLAFGSFDTWAVAILETGCALLFMVWIWPQISTGRLQLKGNSLYAPTALFGLLIVLQLACGLSAYAHATREELWKYAAYGVLLLLASQLRRASARRLLTILAVFGFAVALFALIQDLTYNGKIYWIGPSGPSSFGPYANYSHYAGLMELLTPIPLAMALTEGTKRHLQMLWMVAGILMAATIFICGSRGGMLAFTSEMVVFAGCVVVRTGRRTAWALFVVCLLTASLALWIDDGRMLTKLSSLREPLTITAATRLTITKDSLRMASVRPIAGWGFGVFPVVYPEYRSFVTDAFVNEAHNDYAQALVETGILGFACVVWFILNLYRSAIRNLRAYRGVATAGFLGPLIGCSGILVHSFSDFNLHIPANAALFFVLCGLASTGTQRESSQHTFLI